MIADTGKVLSAKKKNQDFIKKSGFAPPSAADVRSKFAFLKRCAFLKSKICFSYKFARQYNKFFTV